jgi:rod shape-determining protein MreC
MLYVVPTKHRSLALLGAMLLVQVLLLAVQIRRSEDGRGDVRLIRVWAVWAVSPFQRAGAWTVDSITGAWDRYVGLQDTHQRNQQLLAENAQLKLRNQELESQAAEAVRLAALLEFQSTHTEAKMVPARVIGSGAAGAANRIIFINRGEAHGVRRNLPVITPEGVVGKTLEVFADTAQVLLLSDEESGVGVLFADSRTQGVIKGSGKLAEPWLLMDYVVNGETVLPGQRIVTSGQDRIFPKELPVGEVLDATPGSPFQKIRVRPAARLDRLEEVLVMLPRAAPAAAPAPVSGAAKPSAAPGPGQ